MDHELRCVLRNPTADAIHKFENALLSSSQASWTVPMMETLLKGVAKKRPSLLYILARADVHDHVLYAVQQFLPELTDQVLSEASIKTIGIVALVRIWEALERLRSFSSVQTVDTLWMYSHVEPEKLHCMARLAVDVITRCVS